MGFHEVVSRHLTTNNDFIRSEILSMLSEYPLIPEKWLPVLIKKADDSDLLRDAILPMVRDFPVNDEAFQLIVNRIETAKTDLQKIWYQDVLLNTSTRKISEQRDTLIGVIDSEHLDAVIAIADATDQQLFEIFSEHCNTIDKNGNYEHQNFKLGKRMVDELLGRNLVTDERIANIIENELKREWFSSEGIYYIYMIGKLSMESYLPILAKLLLREDDILLVEVSDALIRFHSDDVVRKVTHYVRKNESAIFATKVLTQIKTPLAKKKLLLLMEEPIDSLFKEHIAEGLCYQLSVQGIPRVAAFIKNELEKDSDLELETSLYANCVMNNVEYPKLDELEKSVSQRYHSTNHSSEAIYEKIQNYLRE